MKKREKKKLYDYFNSVRQMKIKKIINLLMNKINYQIFKRSFQKQNVPYLKDRN